MYAGLLESAGQDLMNVSAYQVSDQLPRGVGIFDHGVKDV
jgi:hypothetical protein